MDLLITETNGMFTVFGELNSTNATILKNRINCYINAKNYAILNLKKVSAMDASAAHMLRQLYIGARRSESILSIIGKENQNILPVMRQTKTSYILSHDRI